MLNRRWFGLLLLSAAGLPYVLSSSSKSDKAPEEPWDPASLERPPTSADILSTGASGKLPPLEGARVRGLEEIFRFDVTTGWVLSRWPRVSTGLAELDLQGYRVPLVTGTQPHDVAGSLTYYFNPQQQVERITFVGTTGDSRRLVAALAQHHGFSRKVVSDPGLFLYQANRRGQPTGELRIRSPHVVRADAPYSRFEVALDMRRGDPPPPVSNFRISGRQPR